MDNLRAPDRNELAYWLSQKLRKVSPEVIGRGNPVLGALGGFMKESVTDPVARGLESWAYGDRLLGPPANAPMVNQRTMEMASAVPLGAATGALGKAGPAAAALYAGSKKPNLMMSHSTSPVTLLRGGDLPKELYHPSMGIRNDDVMTEFGPVQLIPQLGKFDPAKSPATLHAMDAYTPRWDKAAGSRADELLEGLDLTKFSQQEMQRILREAADTRNADKMVSSFRAGGLGSEISAKKSMVQGLPQYGQGGFKIGGSPMLWERGRPSVMQLRGLSYGPRFRSFKEFEDSPYGATRLEQGPQHEALYEDVARWAQQYVPNAKNFDFNPATLGEDKVVNAALQQALRGMPHYSKDAVVEARNLVQQLRRTKTDYAENKVWGPVQINPENFAGIIVDTNSMSSDMVNLLQKAAKRRGLQFAADRYSHPDFDPFRDPTAATIANEMQVSNPMPKRPTPFVGPLRKQNEAESPKPFWHVSDEALGAIKAMSDDEVKKMLGWK